jgi:hypothetical protein
MSTLSLRLPESLHKMAREIAQEENISVNQLITLALAEKLSALATEKFFREKAEGHTRARFEKAMAKVADAEPAPFDRLPNDSKESTSRLEQGKSSG